MKLNIDETNDRMREIANNVLAEFAGTENLTDEEWNSKIDASGEYLFMLACETSCVRCPGDQYDTNEDELVADTLRAWLRLRVREIAPNGIPI